MKDAVGKLRAKSRFVMEFRYQAAPEFLDRRGDIVTKVRVAAEKEFPFWQVDGDNVVFNDVEGKAINQFAIGIRRTGVVIEDPDSLQLYTDRLSKYSKLAFACIGTFVTKIDRIGVRVIEVISADRRDFETVRTTVLEKFHKLPADIPLQYVDSQATLIHKNGRYSIGPARKTNDEWVTSVFGGDARLPEVGYGLDVDSFVNNVTAKTANELETAVKSVLAMSLAVEEAVLRAAGARDG